ncbi:hypothetical protein ACLOJK_021608 [Asimina triloba]
MRCCKEDALLGLLLWRVKGIDAELRDPPAFLWQDTSILMAGSSRTHTLDAAMWDSAPPSLAINTLKGPTKGDDCPPRGPWKGNDKAIAALSIQNLGVMAVANAIFGSETSISDYVLTKASS